MGNPTDNTTELDSYGVWVKRPPQDCAEGKDSTTEGLPEFAGLEIPQERDAAEQPEEAASGGFDEFKIEDFMSDNTFSTGGADGEISLDDFLGESAFSSGGAEKEDDISDDEPLDIEISLDESEEDAVPTEPVADEDEGECGGAEEPAFDDMFGRMSGAEGERQDAEADSAALQKLMGSTEDISLDDFGLDGADGAASKIKETESVDLSDFGIDSDAAETPVTSNVKESARKRVVDYDLAITDDDTVQSAPAAAETKSEEKSKQEQYTENTTVSNALLEKIIEDLSGLKNEINALKNDFAELKATGAAAKSCPEQKPSAQAEESGGFFDGGAEEITVPPESGTGGIMAEDAAAEDVPGLEYEFPETDADATVEEVFAEPQLADDEDGAQDAAAEEILVVENEETEIPDVVTDDDLSELLSESEEEASDSDFGGGGIQPDGMGGASEIGGEADEPCSELKIDFDAEILEEPDLNEIESDSDILQDIPEEISVPKAEDDLTPADDILEDSVEFEADAEDDMFIEPQISSELPVEGQAAFGKEDFEAPEVPSDDFSEAADKDADTIEESIEELAIEEPDVADGISEESLDYLNGDSPMEKEDFEEGSSGDDGGRPLPDDLKADVKSVLLYMDQLLENLPEEKIMEFAKSEQFATYKKLFSELGLY